MAYDKEKAHEYYEKYHKKGIKKGRKKGKEKKKGSAKKGKTTSLIGVSSSGLNADGQIEAAVIKDKLKAEMNEKLKGAKSEEEKLAIRKEYSKKANAEMEKLKSNPEFAKQKATKSSGSSKSSSGGSSKSSGGSSKSSGGSSSGEKKSSSTSTPTVKAQQTTTPASVTAPVSVEQKDLLTSLTNSIMEKVSSMGEEQKAQATVLINGILSILKNRALAQSGVTNG